MTTHILGTFRPSKFTVPAFALAAVGAFMLFGADPAFAQDPFGRASTAARSVFSGLSTFALVIGGVGMVACLLLGFFGKLNWKWVWTGVGVAFAIAIVGPTITWLQGLGGSLGSGL